MRTLLAVVMAGRVGGGGGETRANSESFLALGFTAFVVFVRCCFVIRFVGDFFDDTRSLFLF
jgi:hypothetical protein